MVGIRTYLSPTDHRISAWGQHAVLETQQLGSRTNLRYLLLTVLRIISPGSVYRSTRRTATLPIDARMLFVKFFRRTGA